MFYHKMSGETDCLSFRLNKISAVCRTVRRCDCANAKYTRRLHVVGDAKVRNRCQWNAWDCGSLVTRVDNERTIALYGKLGFPQEGLFHQEANDGVGYYDRLFMAYLIH